MPTKTSSRSIELAKQLVAELGSQKAVAQYVGVKQPSVWLWTRRGISELRESYLRERFPELRTWKVFPPVRDDRPEAR